MKAEELRERQEEMMGWPIKIVSYRLENTFICMIYNVDPGGRLTHASGATRDEAESSALEKARVYVHRSGYRTT